MNASAPRLPASQAGIAMPRLLLMLGGVLAILVLLLGMAAALVIPSLPDISALSDYQPKLPLRIMSADGVQIGEFGAERRRFVPLKEIPQQLQDALLAIEDTHFYEHDGVSYTGILRAFIANAGASRSQGASTITQQLARTFYLSREKKYYRKFVEALLAKKIESELSKEQILEIYMNQIYLGQRAYGFGAAAQIYFGKPLQELSLAENAMLAGLPQNALYANPVANFARAQRRQHVVLERMRTLGQITDAQAQAARAQPLRLRTAQDARSHAEFAAEMVRQVVFAKYGEESYSRGLIVHTTIRADQQDAAYRGLRKTLMDYERRKPWRGPEGHVDLPDNDEAEQDAAITHALAEHPDNDELRAAVVTQASPTKVLVTLQSGEDLVITGEGLRGAQSGLSGKARAELRVERGSIIRVLRGAPTKAEPKGAWAITQQPEAEGAFVALDPQTGAVRALVGGFDFSKNKFNHATQAWRQPGSSFKPLVYSAALEQGLTPDTVVNDAPITIGDWEPKNYESQYDGPLTVRQALARSKNMVTVRVMQLLGAAKVRDWAGHFGLDVDKQPDNLTLGLGSGSVTPLQMAQAYAVLANGGYRVAPLIIERITDSKGQVLFEAAPEPRSEEQRAISERNAFVTASLLQEVTRSGTAARAQAALHRPDIYGKTGTTNDAVDAWFVGFQPGLVAAVWIGHDNPKPMGDRESGGGLALPAWIDFMTVALRGVPVAEIQPPAEGLTRQGEGWVFEEYAGEAGIRSIGLDNPPPATAASGPG